MQYKRCLATILMASSLAFGFPGYAAVKGTWNSDGSCSGYPEASCGWKINSLAKPVGETALVNCFASIQRDGGPPFPSSIVLASSKADQLSSLVSASEPIRISLNLPFAWVTSGAWTEDGSLLLVDSQLGELLRLSGSRLNPVDLGGLQVSGVQATEGGFILKLRSQQFVAVDKRGRLIETLGSLLSEGGAAGVKSVVNWVPVGDSLLAFGDTLTADSNWESGWLNIPLHDPASFGILRSMPVTGAERKLYLLGSPYAASIGSTGYLLTVGRMRPQLLKVSPRPRGIELRELPFPLDLQAASSIQVPFPMGGEPEDIVGRYEALEKTSVPAGLYSQGGNLYILIRRPGRQAEQVEWELVRLDTESGSIRGRVVLPTRANHLLVIPGKRLWAIVEKGNVRAPGQQEIEGLLLVSASWIESGYPAGQERRNHGSAKATGLSAGKQPERDVPSTLLDRNIMVVAAHPER